MISVIFLAPKNARLPIERRFIFSGNTTLSSAVFSNAPNPIFSTLSGRVNSPVIPAGRVTILLISFE